MDLNGYYGGSSRLPFLPLSGEQKAEIERLMAGIKSSGLSAARRS